MGGNASNLIPQPAGFDYMCISLRISDRIRLLYANDREISAVREAISQFWYKGLQEENAKFGGAHEFKVRGNPFSKATTAKEAAATRRFACNMLFRLYNSGCKLLISSDLTQTSDLTTWFFHREQTVFAQFDFACIGVSSSDKLQFVNFPPAMQEFFKDVVTKNWPQQIQRVEFVGETMEIKLNGNPWRSSTSSENIQCKTLIKALINELGARQWSLYGSSNLKSTADTIFFRYDPGFPTDGFLATGFVIALSRDDRIRCIDAPSDVFECVKAAVNEFWVRGIQHEKPKFNAMELKLAGNPWWATGTEAVDSRFLMCKIFERLLTIGWKAQLGIDLSRKINDKSVFTFQRCQPCSLPIFCLSLNETDKIRFINAPQNVIDTLKVEIARTWLFGISRESQYGRSLELKLKQNPWSFGYNGHDGLHARIMLCHIIRACAQIGWFAIISADVSSKYIHQENGPDYPIDVHSIWFIWYGQSFAPTQPQFPQLPSSQFGLQESDVSQFGAGLATAPTGFASAPTGFASAPAGLASAPAGFASAPPAYSEVTQYKYQ